MPSTPTPPRRRRWLVAAALLGLVALGLVVLFLLPAWIERMEYAAERGRQRASVEAAPVPTAAAATPSESNGILLAELSRASERISQRVGPSVVHVQSESRPAQTEGDNDLLQLFESPEARQAVNQGSGVIVDEAGYILTNWHVVREARAIQVVLDDDRRLDAELIGEDALTDLALLKVTLDEVASERLVAAQWGDSDTLQVGALVWAVGSPFGLERTVTFGILSAKNRRHVAGSAYHDFLQTDAAVNPGNSGGPLVDAEGRVVGINTAILGNVYQGISFAIPSSIARSVYERLRSEGRVERGWIGVMLDEVTPARQAELRLPDTRGAYVVTVYSEGMEPSPAVRAGLRGGDVILSWNGERVDTPTMLSRLIAQTPVGSTGQMELLRRGQRLTLAVPVESRP